MLAYLTATAATAAKSGKGDGEKTDSVYAKLAAHIASEVPNYGDAYILTAATVNQFAPDVLPKVADWDSKRSGIRDYIINKCSGLTLHAPNAQADSVKTAAKSLGATDGIMLVKVPATVSGTRDGHNKLGAEWIATFTAATVAEMTAYDVLTAAAAAATAAAAAAAASPKDAKLATAAAATAADYSAAAAAAAAATATVDAILAAAAATAAVDGETSDGETSDGETVTTA